MNDMDAFFENRDSHIYDYITKNGILTGSRAFGDKYFQKDSDYDYVLCREDYEEVLFMLKKEDITPAPSNYFLGCHFCLYKEKNERISHKITVYNDDPLFYPEIMSINLICVPDWDIQNWITTTNIMKLLADSGYENIMTNKSSRCRMFETILAQLKHP